LNPLQIKAFFIEPISFVTDNYLLKHRYPLMSKFFISIFLHYSFIIFIF